MDQSSGSTSPHNISCENHTDISLITVDTLPAILETGRCLPDLRLTSKLTLLSILPNLDIYAAPLYAWMRSSVESSSNLKFSKFLQKEGPEIAM